MSARRTSVVVSLAALALSAAPARAAVCTVDWDGGGGDLRWSTALNWSGNALPGATDVACIPGLSGAPVEVDVPVTVATVAASHPVLVTSSLSATLEGGSYTLADGSTLAGAKILGATVLVPLGEKATLAGGEFAGGTLTGAGEAQITGTYTWTTGRMRGDGVTSVAPGAVLTIHASGDNGSPQRYSASVEDDRHLQNSGQIVWTDGYVGFNDQATIHNAGTLTLLSTTDSWESNIGTTDAAIVNTGLIERPSGTNRVSLPGIDNDGTIRVTRGRLELYTLLQTSDGRIEFDLGGTTPMTEHGVIRSLFSTRLAGTLAVTLSTGYSPADTDVFQVLSAGRKGTFGALELPPLSGGRTLAASYTSTGLDLTVVPPPAAESTSTATPTRSAAPAPLAAPAPVSAPAPLFAADDVIRRRVARTIVLGGLLANDTFPARTRVELVAAPRGVRARVDRRTNHVRLRLRARPRVLKLRYRLVAPDGRRSRVASVVVRLGRPRAR